MHESLRGDDHLVDANIGNSPAKANYTYNLV